MSTGVMATNTAPAPPVTPATLVTLKVSYHGATRRFKLPLREMVPNLLENRIRAVLNIRGDADVLFERYSDSATSYVVLDIANTAVYKQLYRAAKAKQKLKLRVTVKEEAPAQTSLDSLIQTAEPVETPIEKPVEAPLARPFMLPKESVEAKKAEEAREGPKPASVADDVEEETTATLSSSTEVSKEVEQVKPVEQIQPVEVPEPVEKSRFSSYEEAILRLQEQQRSCAIPPAIRPNYAVCCNSCDKNVPDVHYHCSKCDGGDFDLCQECVDAGIACYGADHWLIKRFIKNGLIISSTTETLPPKQVKQAAPPSPPSPAAEQPCVVPTVSERIIPVFNGLAYSSMRTCNCCVQELPEVEFVHCSTCDDYDLCRRCFAKNTHGHHPKHAFVAAVEGTRLEPDIARRLGAGRGQKHNAICDGCDANIRGIRHKCLNCPDWDYCTDCMANASFIHPGHRFVPIYEPLEYAGISDLFARPTHQGICCDGPLCSVNRNNYTYITGDRYKCAVCNDTDFCEACEASPANTHNRTHPLIKFKTPVRHVSVTTTGENENGRAIPTMGDRRRVTTSRATETVNAPVLSSSNVQTVVDVKPEEHEIREKVEEKPAEKVEVKTEEVQEEKPATQATPARQADLVAVFVKDTIADGTVMEPNHVFEQTWILRNEGKTAWPAGCSVLFVGGDYMGHVDSSHPAATQDLRASSVSTVCYSPILPGEEFPFTVLLRTPLRTGRIVSNWRLTTPDGLKFGHRLWCDVKVEHPKVATPVVFEPVKEEREVAAKPELEVTTKEPEIQQSQMIFPKLEKESPVSSLHEDAKSESAVTYDKYEDCEDDDWDAAESDEGFLTDEEYDILDASDEEYTEARARK
ncbi:hypothetical protein QBC40DRAFT_176538 [Triangularia verruculosa]|uniref:ZZ-type domain-containing protein n=1 Tax=Triangularia verruculosa TaxID=2587418 RepID=A0AAN7AUR0_9PEZI|nr:hypothetical protein QBC40DRAFT_176538 [Triangularia verruculosa]